MAKTQNKNKEVEEKVEEKTEESSEENSMPVNPDGVEAGIVPNNEKKEQGEEVEEKDKSNKAVAVFSKENKLVRVYSVAEHGKDYKKLAEEFAAKKGGKVESYTIPKQAPVAEEEKEVVKVLTPSGDVHRVFTLSQHGEDYRKVAEEFVKKYEKRNYKIVG